MKKLLIHSLTFARLEAALKPFATDLVPAVMGDDAEMSYPWGESEADHTIAFGNTDIYFSGAAPAFFQALFAENALDWFQSSAAGTEHPMLQAIGKKAVKFTNSHAQAEAIAEWVLWAGFDHFQNGAERREAQAAKDWRRIPAREISDTHWLIIGFGAIGQATGQRLRALGAYITGVRRSGGTSTAADRMIGTQELEQALGKADAVLLSLPHTPETEGLADAAFFAAMKQDALFLNVGRGALVDEAALLTGLDVGRPGQAILDVFEMEPYPSDGPFWAHPRVTMTAHISAATAQANLRTDQIFLDNLKRYIAGETLHNLVSADVFA